jgi:hypothetical protein
VFHCSYAYIGVHSYASLRPEHRPDAFKASLWPPWQHTRPILKGPDGSWAERRELKRPERRLLQPCECECDKRTVNRVPILDSRCLTYSENLAIITYTFLSALTLTHSLTHSLTYLPTYSYCSTSHSSAQGGVNHV